MKTLELNQMELVNGGSFHGNTVTEQCAVSLAGALIFGTGALMFAATGGVAGIAFAMAGNYFGWGMAAWSCS